MNSVIVAISTSPGEGAIGVVRVSGQSAIQIVSNVFRTKDGIALNRKPERYMNYGHIADGDLLYDEVLVVYYKAPKSYTRENMVEIFAHGSYISLVEIQNLLIKNGAIVATPGEFTKRAFLNGRIDLSQAEAIMDMISAKTKKGFDVALNQLEGQLAERINALIEIMTDILAQIEVVIDYPDEEVEVISTEKITQALCSILSDLEDLAKSYNTGKIIREGLSLVIIGKPNVGKSSLLNALLKQNRAIVTEIAGTTRDIIEEYANIRGIPIKLVDTAGIRETDDMIERIGVEKTKEHFNKSDMALLVFNASEILEDEDRHILEVVDNKKVIVIINKVDLEQTLDVETIKNHLPDAPVLYTSVRNEWGIDELEDLIEKQVLSGEILAHHDDMLTNARHYEAIIKAKDSIENSLLSLQNKMPLDIIEVDLMDAYSALGEVTGRSVHEDVINRIFEKFCLGK